MDPIEALEALVVSSAISSDCREPASRLGLLSESDGYGSSTLFWGFRIYCHKGLPDYTSTKHLKTEFAELCRISQFGARALGRSALSSQWVMARQKGSGFGTEFLFKLYGAGKILGVRLYL